MEEEEEENQKMAEADVIEKMEKEDEGTEDMKEEEDIEEMEQDDEEGQEKEGMKEDSEKMEVKMEREMEEERSEEILELEKRERMEKKMDEEEEVEEKGDGRVAASPAEEEKDSQEWQRPSCPPLGAHAITSTVSSGPPGSSLPSTVSQIGLSVNTSPNNCGDDSRAAALWVHQQLPILGPLKFHSLLRMSGLGDCNGGPLLLLQSGVLGKSSSNSPSVCSPPPSGLSPTGPPQVAQHPEKMAAAVPVSRGCCEEAPSPCHSFRYHTLAVPAGVRNPKWAPLSSPPALKNPVTSSSHLPSPVIPEGDWLQVLSAA
ncbi:hypothetical protein STEG23_018882 [Scotinomys teguina]